MRIFLDVDGTLAERIRMEDLPVMKTAGFFLNRKETPLVKELQDALFGEWSWIAGAVYACTAYMADSPSLQEKKIWLGEKTVLDDAHLIFTPCGTNKADAVEELFQIETLSPTDILVDDFSKNLQQWTEAGGTGIKYLNGENGLNGTWKGARASSFEEILQIAMSILRERRYL